MRALSLRESSVYPSVRVRFCARAKEIRTRAGRFALAHYINLLSRYKNALSTFGSKITPYSSVKTEECKDHRLYRATPPDRDTGKGYKYRFIFILLIYALFYTWLHFCLSFSLYNQFLLCVFRSLLSLPLANHASHTVGRAILTTCALCLCLLIHYFLFLLVSGIVSLLSTKLISLLPLLVSQD